MDESQQVMTREGRLQAGDGIQCDDRIGDDPLTTEPSDVAVFRGLLGFLGSILAPGPSSADLVVRLEPDLLVRKRAMIDARVDVEFGQTGVDVLGSDLAPVFEEIGTVPVADLGTEAAWPGLARRQHDVGVQLGLAVRPEVPVNVEVGDHANRDKLALD
jgi:hypothetical protein